MTTANVKSGVEQVLLITVGQTAAPIMASITEHTPDGVIFIASQQSHPVVGKVLTEFSDGFKHYTFLLDDPESLAESYQKATHALEHALSWEPQAISADITGGTKPMVAGVVLALTGRGVTFSYVGGPQRDETGRVVSGTEEMRWLEDPTTRFHLREWDAFIRSWNGWRFSDAHVQLEHILNRTLSRSEQRFYQHLKHIVAALDAWDCFHHRDALALLNAHLEPALTIAEAWRHGSKVRVLSELERQQQTLQRLVDAAETPIPELLADLLANAERRAATDRYDDALARLYRAVELAAEVDFYERHGFMLRAPDEYRGGVPKELRERARRTLGLREVLELAATLDTFFQQQGTLCQRLDGDYRTRLGPLLEKRHQSILAHGLRPVSSADYTALRDYLRGLDLVSTAPWPIW